MSLKKHTANQVKKAVSMKNQMKLLLNFVVSSLKNITTNTFIMVKYATKIGCYVSLLLLITGALHGQNPSFKKNAIQPWKNNPRYWQYKGKPVMLLGASNDDNLFQWPSHKLIPHLDSMKRIGANYVRNTMSDRRDKGFELYPFKQLEDGLYDLHLWDDEYWKRFEKFLKETKKRDIIVQIELWDRFDYSQKHWLTHPYNPKNNVNYSYDESGLANEYPEHAGQNRQPFFFTTPKQRNNPWLLPIQKKFIAKVLSYSLSFDHVLYCIDNETSGEEEWSIFWRDFIVDKAREKGKAICVTEMWDDWNLQADRHRRTLDHPDRFRFCDVSQNTHQRGDRLWNNLQWALGYIEAAPRPVNVVKTYGADGGRHGNTRDAIKRWWLHLLGGVASVRFHRPDSGLGLSAESIASVRVARIIEQQVPFWELHPCNHVLANRSENSAYLTATPGKIYVAFLPKGGSVRLDLDGTSTYSVRWLNVRQGEWHEAAPQEVVITSAMPLQAPGNDEWVLIATKKSL